MSVCKIKAKKNKTTAFQFFLMISTFQHPFGFVRQPSEFFSEFQMGAHDLFAIIFYTSPCMFYIYAPPVSPFLRKIFNKNKNREREREKTTLQFLSGSRYYKKSRVRSECRSRKKRTGFNLNTLPAA